jgi:lipopolysaccharide biosynthesis glycosyltransferase
LNLVFTICANNYLAHAKALSDSWRRHNPDTRFFLFLVDEPNPDIDYSFLQPGELIDIKKVRIPDFDSLALKFNITELSTAVKPYIFSYLFDHNKAGKIIYLDPDIYIFNPFTEVLDLLDNSNIIITPHILSGVDDDKQPTDYHTLNGGVYNLGFLALSDHDKVKDFLDWWTDRTAKYGFGRLEKNMFYDQVWINYVPCFYDNYHILKHPGYNMANWNLHERTLSETSPGQFLVNGKSPLVFFHYSGYKFSNPESIGFYHTRYDFHTRPDLKPVFDIYQAALVENRAAFLKTIPSVYFELYKTNQARLKAEYEKSRPSLTRRVFQKVMFRLKHKMG